MPVALAATNTVAPPIAEKLESALIAVAVSATTVAMVALSAIVTSMLVPPVGVP